MKKQGTNVMDEKVKVFIENRHEDEALVTIRSRPGEPSKLSYTFNKKHMIRAVIAAKGTKNIKQFQISKRRMLKYVAPKTWKNFEQSVDINGSCKNTDPS